jgi:hypothetical protein
MVGFLMSVGRAQAHRLDAQAFLLPGNKLQVEAWFSSGEPARGANVEVHGAGDRLIAAGKMDEKGIFACTFEHHEALRIVIAAGAEHRKELRITATELSQTGADPVPLADRSESVPIKDALIGINLLLTLAMIGMYLRLRRQLAALEAKIAGLLQAPSWAAHEHAGQAEHGDRDLR